MERLAKKVLLVGWDGADWKIINKLMDEGKMPALKSLVDHGIMGNLATLDPPFSPMLWTTIATGVRPDKHGIVGFSEPIPGRHGVQPVSSASRKVKAIWNILTQKGIRSHIVGWWPSHPAEPINGTMISNHFQRATGPIDKPWPLAPGTVHPPELSELFAHFRVHPQELTHQHIQPFVPDFEKVDQKKDKRLESIAKITAEAASLHAATTLIMETEQWDLMAVYLDAIDHFCHGFMNFHPPRLMGTPEEQFELYKGVIESGYRYHDMMLGRLVQMAGEEVTVMVISDHGFHSDHLRPPYIPDEPAGPAMQHRDHGILVVKGPGIRRDERIYGASLLDITPTLLTLFGLPVGEDMDGTPLVQLFENEVTVDSIPSWEEVEGEAGMLPRDVQDDPLAAQEALKQLVELGYIEEPGEDMELAVTRTVKEMRYNLGRVYLGANRYDKATPLFEELYTNEPDQPRFALRLAQCYLALNELEKCDTLLQDFMKHESEYIKTHSFEKIKEEKMPEELEADDKQKEREKWQREYRRKISRLQMAYSDILQLQLMRGDLLLKQNKPAQALKLYQAVAQRSRNKSLHIQVGNALLKLKRWKLAKESFLKALEYDEDAFAPHLGLCRVYSKLRQHEEAVEHGHTATGLVYYSPMAHYYLGEALLLYGDYEHAEQAFKVALAISPNLGQARNYLIYLFEEILNAPEKAAGHRAYFTGRGLNVRSPKEEGFDEDVEENFNDEQVGEPTDETLDEAGNSGKDAAGGTEAQTEEDPKKAGQPAVVQRQKLITSEPVIVVSGLPRSGTSIMMQMLDAAGMPIYTDKQRQPDESNPKGYYEHENVKRLMRDASWIKETPGKVVKIIAQLLPYIPARYMYKIIFMDRSLDEVVRSQHAMLIRSGSKRVKADVYPYHLKTQFQKQLERIKNWQQHRANVDVLWVKHKEALENPLETARKVAGFLGREMDVPQMAASVDASLYRTKA